MEEGLAGAVEAGLDVARVTEEVAVQVGVVIVFLWSEGEGESGEGSFGEDFFRFVALRL